MRATSTPSIADHSGEPLQEPAEFSGSQFNRMISRFSIEANVTQPAYGMKSVAEILSLDHVFTMKRMMETIKESMITNAVVGECAVKNIGDQQKFRINCAHHSATAVDLL